MLRDNCSGSNKENQDSNHKSTDLTLLLTTTCHAVVNLVLLFLLVQCWFVKKTNNLTSDQKFIKKRFIVYWKHIG